MLALGSACRAVQCMQGSGAGVAGRECLLPKLPLSLNLRIPPYLVIDPNHFFKLILKLQSSTRFDSPGDNPTHGCLSGSYLQCVPLHKLGRFSFPGLWSTTQTLVKTQIKVFCARRRRPVFLSFGNTRGALIKLKLIQRYESAPRLIQNLL